MQETPSPQGPAQKSRPPYLFLIPAALGIVGFIGYQTVRMGTTDTHVISRSPFAIDTSVAQAVVSHGVITVHANRPPSRPQPQRVAEVKPTAEPASPKPAGSPSPVPSPSTPGKGTPSPRPTPTKALSHAHAKKVAAKPAHVARHGTEASDDTIAQEPVSRFRPVSARPIASVNVSREQPSQTTADATTPPITDAPSVHREEPKPPVQVAEAPKVPDAGSTINAVDRVVEAKMVYAAAPDYPEIARDQGARGTSVVFVTVDPAGSIVHVSIASSSGNSVLDRSALSAARSSRYAPPKVDGRPALETYRVTYDFSP